MDVPTQPCFATVPPELWAKLRAFDPHCFISLTRSKPFDKEWQHTKRTWRVRIHHDRSKAWEGVDVEHPRLVVALEKAVGEAEAKGWATSSAAPEC